MSRRIAGGAVIAGLLASWVSAAAPPHHRTATIGAETASGPTPEIVLKWKAASDAVRWTLYRRSLDDEGAENWGPAIDIPVEPKTPLLRHSDKQVSVGAAYEYRLDKTARSDGQEYSASTFLLVGLDEPPIERRGKLILLVDDRFVDSLRPELVRLTQDLIGDGWEVLRRDVASTRTVRQVKALIRADYVADPAGVKAVFLLGRLPVPYSGNISPDGHREDHLGAWPADVYYGDMDEELWTDVEDFTRVNGRAPRIAKHANLPGDGKFDPSTIPGDGRVELAVGRVDLSDMPAFAATETELLRRYLEKNHRYRHRDFEPARRAVNIDGFGYGEDGYRNFTPILGAHAIAPKPSLSWFSSLRDDSHLWAYGAGGGQPTSCITIGTTADFAHNQVRSVFHILYGSYFGVWDDSNSLLRAPLASSPSGLTCQWGRKHWTLHETGLGRPIGFSVRRSQSRAVVKSPGNHGVQTALMGDPTLRLFMAAPPSDVRAEADGERVVVRWNAAPDAVDGYHVYRRTDVAAPFVRLTGDRTGASGFIVGDSFIDAAPADAPAEYLVRSVKRETVNSGSYFNLSQGVPAAYPQRRTSLKSTTTTHDDRPATTLVASFPVGAYQTVTVAPESRPDPTSVCSWTGAGSVPASGTGTSVRVFLDQDSAIEWRWRANRAATIQIVSPASGQNFTQPAQAVDFEATVQDPDGQIRKVEFYVGDTLVGEDLDSVYDFVADPSGVAYKARGQSAVASYRHVWKDVPDGRYALKVKAYDVHGGSTVSAPTAFTVGGKNRPPEVAILFPARGAAYREGAARFNLQAAARDDGRITKVEYFLGEKRLGAAVAAPYHLWQELPPGTHTFTAFATDHQGATARSEPVTITVAGER